jgi:hypothetical protein
VFWSDVSFGQDYCFTKPWACQATSASLWHFLPLLPVRAVLLFARRLASAAPQSNGLYFGTWQGADLRMKRAIHRGNVDFVQWQYAVVASSAGDRSVLYAAVSASGTATLRLKEAFLRASMKIPPFKVSRLAQVLGVSPPASLAALIRKVNPPGHTTSSMPSFLPPTAARHGPGRPNQRVEESIRLPRDPGQTQEG